MRARLNYSPHWSGDLVLLMSRFWVSFSPHQPSAWPKLVDTLMDPGQEHGSHSRPLTSTTLSLVRRGKRGKLWDRNRCSTQRLADLEAEGESQTGHGSSPFHSGEKKKKKQPKLLLVTFEHKAKFKKKSELCPSLFHHAINLGFY